MRKLPGKKVRLSDSALSNQRGIVVPMVAIGLLAILAVAGLALDGSHALGNKTRMQNTADAAALAAAKVLDDTDGDTGLATAAANSLFSINADADGNHELNDAYDAGDITVTVQYSTTVNPFVPGSPNGPFVRVIATGFETQTTLSRVLGINDIATPATAVAGPSGPLGSGAGALICDLAPIAVCEDDIPPVPDPDDPAAPPRQEVLRVLKPNPGTHGDVGPGNYKMLRLFDCSGGACLRQHMAGSYDECLEMGTDLETEPGVSSGPVSQGFNTRFYQYQGAGLNPVDYPPDKYIGEQDIDADPGDDLKLKACEDPDEPLTEYIFLTDTPGNNFCNGFDPDLLSDPDSDWSTEQRVTLGSEIPYNYARYTGLDPASLDDPVAADPMIPLAGRRLLRFPLIDCSGENSGQSALTSTNVACFFMVQSLEGGQADGAGNIFGQFIDSCPANGTVGIIPGGGPPNQLLYKIQLYKDPDSSDS